MTLEKGKKAPDFSGPVSTDDTVSLADFKGKRLVLYFYPKDNTPGCTTEAQDFQANLKEFEKANTAVIGVSKDSLKRHQNFQNKFGLEFPLIADEEGAICEAYGVWQEKKNYGKTYMGIVRSTFLIDENGKIAEAWHNVRVKNHVEKVLDAAKSL